MSLIHMKVARRTITVLALTVSGTSLAQTVSIPTDSTTYPAGINPKPAVVSQCMGCHGAQGMSQFPDWPNLAGLSNDYIKGELLKFKDGQRKNAMMRTVVNDLSDEQINQVATYFSEQKVTVNVPATLARPKGLETCIACHGDGAGQAAAVGPSIAGQKEGYMLKQIEAFRNGQRNNEIMTNIIKSLSPEDVQGIVQYYSRMNTRLDSATGAK